MIVGITDEYSSDPAGLFRHLKFSTLDAGGTVALGVWALQRNKKILLGQSLCAYLASPVCVSNFQSAWAEMTPGRAL